MYLPLTLAAVGNIPMKEIGGASAFLSLTRQLGGSVGIALLTTLLVRRTDFHRVVLVEKVTPFSAEAQSRIQALTSMWRGQGFSPVDARDHALKMIDGIVQRQAIVISYADLSWLLSIALVLTMPFVIVLSSGKKGAPKDIEMH
jgi:DHA2 family multidrug resistance protein